MTGTIRKRQANVWELTPVFGRDPNGQRHGWSRTVRGTQAKAKRELRSWIAEAERVRSRTVRTHPWNL